MVEAKTPAEPTFIPPFSYEYFVRTCDPKTGEYVAFVPLEPVFSSGIITFNKGDLLHDVGAGAGRSSEYLLSQIPPHIRATISLVVSEPSEDFLKLTQSIEKFDNAVGHFCAIEFDANRALGMLRDLDAITFLNGIHLVDERERDDVTRKAYEVLKPGGKFLVSTTFIEEWADKVEKKRFIDPWMLRVFKKELPALGVDPRPILRNLHKVKLSMWKAERYRESFRQAGFEILMGDSNDQPEFQIMPCTLASYEGICRYPVWINNILPGVDLERGSAALTSALKRTWEELGRDENSISPRNTLVVVARKPKIEGEIKRL